MPKKLLCNQGNLKDTQTSLGDLGKDRLNFGIGHRHIFYLSDFLELWKFRPNSFGIRFWNLRQIFLKYVGSAYMRGCYILKITNYVYFITLVNFIISVTLSILTSTAPSFSLLSFLKTNSTPQGETQWSSVFKGLQT